MALFKLESTISVPQRLEVIGDKIAAYYGDTGLSVDPTATKKRRVIPQILDDFLRLEDNDDILQFVARYGFLNARLRECTCALPHKVEETRTLQRVTGADGYWLGERLQDWGLFIFRVKSYHQSIQAIQNGKLRPAERRRAVKQFTEAQLPFILDHTDLWPTLAWSEDRQTWALVVGSNTADGVPGFSGALSAVVYFLMRSALHPDDTAVCSLCGQDYTLLNERGEPVRRPTESRANYCQSCRGSKAMHRRIKRAYRAKRAAQ